MGSMVNPTADPTADPIAPGLLARVSQPSRYVGGESNATHKPWDSVAIHAALVFPDTYEIGISNMGLQILYRIINSRDDALAERAYAPWPDYEAELRRRKIPLCSLESRTSLGAFDMLGISVPYELTYTNILNVLDLAGLPLRTEHRDRRHPVVIGGGSGVYNPEPIAPFFDAFLLGDGEEVIHELLDAVGAWRGGSGDRTALHHALARIPGVYVPSLYQVHHHPDGRVAEIVHQEPAPPTVLRRVVADLDAAPYPDNPLVPNGKAVFGRVNVEVTRGCTHGCRFCQAGFTYRPVRERSPERVQELVLAALKNTGSDQVTLSSLSTGDYLCLYPVLKELMDATRDQKVAFSLPSLRIGTLTPAVVRQIKRVTKTGFTMAPEAGSERLRKVINKPISEVDLMQAVENVFAEGWPDIKFYFMYGLPTEELADLDGIVRLAGAAVAAGRRAGGRPRGIRVSTSNYVPKPMTPFQWVGQMSLDELHRRRHYLQDGLRRIPGVRFTWNDPRESQLEAVFSRGDRRLAPVVEAAFQRGMRMDAWGEQVDLDGWDSLFSAHGVDVDFYARREIPVDEVLPWDMLDVGTDKAYFAADLARARREAIIRDCRYGLCGDCGVCTADASGRLVVPRVYVPEGERAREFNLPMAEDAHNHPLVPEVVDPEVVDADGVADGMNVDLAGSADPADNAPNTLRLQWTKRGPLVFLSHLEVLSVVSRAVRRAELPVAISQAKRPRLRIGFGPALALGTESIAEVMDLTLTRTVDPAALMDAMNVALPVGLEISAVAPVPRGGRSLDLDGMVYDYDITWPSGPPPELEEAVRRADSASKIIILRRDKKGRERLVDIRPLLQNVTAHEGRVTIRLGSDGNRSVRPLNVLREAMGLAADWVDAARIRRTALLFPMNQSLYSLMDPTATRSVVRLQETLQDTIDTPCQLNC